MRAPVVALLTDFGLSDPYVGVVKSVIAGIAPGATVIDLTHGIPPHDVRAGAFALRAAWPYLPAEAVVCAVVDPGVGTARRPVALELDDGTARRRLVCPDNGLASALGDAARVLGVVELDDPAYHLPRVGATFHGRDLFAPVTAHLAAGTTLAAVGSPLAPDALVPLAWPRPRRRGRNWEATVLYRDRFGNLITNLPESALGHSHGWRIVDAVSGRSAPLVETFAAVEPGEPLAYWGSSGLLELAVRNGSAAEAWGLDVGAALRAELSAGSDGG